MENSRKRNKPVKIGPGMRMSTDKPKDFLRYTKKNNKIYWKI